MILLITLITFVMLVISGVSAENVDAIDASDINEVSVSTNGISDVGSNDIQSLSSNDGNPVNVPQEKNLKASSADSTSINVKVNYEYQKDANIINPDFYVVSEDKYLNFTKNYDSASQKWTLNLGTAVSSDCNITAMAAGYVSESKLVSAASLSDLVTFDLKATDAYKLGQTVSAAADKELNFATADDILVVSTAGVASYNGKTSEDAMEAILNYDKSIAYSNLLMLRQTAVDPIDFAFIVKKGNELKAVVFQNASTTPVYKGTISENMTKKEWNAYYNAVTGENAWSFASLANGWAAGVSREILQEAAFHGHICEGTLGGYSIIQTLLKYYPPVQETNPGGAGSPADITSYKVLGVPGGSDDDAALFFLDDTIGKTGYVGMDTSKTGAAENMLGFIRWYSANSTGDLIIMSFNSSNVKKLFTKETGIDPDAGSLEELKYNSWWIKQIKNNPEKLVDILYEFTGLNADQYYYLMGTQVDVQSDDEVIQAIDAHGLDMEYILSLNLSKATRANVDNTAAHLSDAELKQIGFDAANKAKEIFKEELGVDIEKDDVDFLVLTDAGYAFLNGQDTSIIRDAFYETFGATLYSQTLMSLHQAVWKPLWFAFAFRYPDSDIVNMIYLRYNPSTNDFFIGDLDGKKVVDIGFNTLNDSDKLKAIAKTFVPDGNWFNVQTEINAWKEHPLFDQMAAFLYHAHVCPGVQPGFFETEYILNELPLGENESYTYIGTNTYCKDDSLTYLLGISPGMGTFIVKKIPDTEHVSEYIEGRSFYNGAIIVWDDNLKVGKVNILSLKSASFDLSKYATSEASRAAQIRAFIQMYDGQDNPDVVSKPVVSIDGEKWINEEQFNMLKTGVNGSNLYNYIHELPNVTKEDLLKSMENTTNSGENANSNGDGEGNGTNSGDNTNSNSNSNSNTNSNSNSNSNSNLSAPTSTNSAPSQRSSSSSVGSSGALATAAPTAAAPTAEEVTDADESEDADDADDSSSEASTYEVSKTPATKSADSNALVYALVGVLAIGALLGLGYMRRNK